MSVSNPNSVDLAACGARSMPVRRGHWLTSTALGAAGLFALGGVPAASQSLPVYSGQTPPSGIASIDTAADSVTVHQSASKAVINWDSFNVGAGKSVSFNQPSTSAITLNRDMSGQLSTIDGTITANGQVWLLNPNGVFISSGGSISARGFLGTTHAISDADFISGDYRFSDAAAGGYGHFAEVVNEGHIDAANGYAVLAGREVRNGLNSEAGIISAELGTVVLAGVPTFTMGIGGDKLLSFAVGGGFTEGSDNNPLVSNLGGIFARGGRVMMTARAASNVVASVMNVSGLANATNVEYGPDGIRLIDAPPGTIEIDGGQNGQVNVEGLLVADSATSAAAGTIRVLGDTVMIMGDGQLLAEAPQTGGSGGRIEVAGSAIEIDALTSDAPTISASGHAGGGSILIGAGSNGSLIDGRALPNGVYVGSNTRIYADAFEGGSVGNGGTVTIWGNSNSTTGEPNVSIFGQIFARSGLSGGNGGTIELGGASVDVRAAGALNVAGTVNGGELRLIGDRIRVETYDPVEFDSPPGLYAWGYAGSGGSIKIGGDIGGTELAAGRGIATEVLIGDGTQIDAGASLTGNGGTIAIWSGATGKTTINGAFIYAGGGQDGGKGGVVQVGGHDVELAYDSDYGYGYGYNTYIDASGSAFRFEGELFSEGGLVDIVAANNIRIGEGAQLYATGFTTAGRINLAAGTSILHDGLIDASICCSSSIASISESEFLTTGTGSINLSAGQYIRSRAGAIFGDGNISITAGIGVSLEHRSEYNGDFYEEVPTFIIGNNITLTADALGISRLPFDEPGAEVIATSSLTIQPLSANRNIRAGGNPDPAPSMPSTDSEFVPIGADFTAGSTTLVLDELELDAFEAPSVALGRIDGTGALSVFFSRDLDDAPDSCESGCDLDGPSTTIVQMGGAGGTITLFGQEAIDAVEKYRFIAGSSITLADDFQMEVNGKLELVSGGSFTNLSGADALTTPAGGQWLVYSADPSLDSFGGLLSGQTALWGQSFANVSANGLVHSGNRYAFGLAPTVTVTALNRAKTYGDTLDLSAPVLGAGYTISGLVNAAQFGNVFTQDVITGAPTLASSGSGATANAGSYAIVAGNSTGLAPAGYNLVFQSGVLTVDPRLLTVALAGSTQKVYDATTAATLSAANYSLAGFVNGDGAIVGQTKGSFASANVGSNINVTASLGAADFVANAGTALSNYVLPTSASGAIGSITPATLTYVANPATRRRNNPNPPLSGTVTGFVGGETQATATTGTLAFDTSATADSPAGTYAINGGGLAAANYVFVQAPGNATALLVQDNVAPAQQVTTQILQQVTSAIRTPTTAPTPTPPLPTVTGGTTNPVGGTAGGSLALSTGGSRVPGAPPPPPPPPPLSPTPASGTNTLPPPPGPSVEATPPSPVGETAPPTPSDAADQGDPVLAEAETEEQDEAPTEKRQLASTTAVAPGVNVEAPTPPRPPEVPGADQSFSGSGNPAQW